jgi:hypothetical protein
MVIEGAIRDVATASAAALAELQVWLCERDSFGACMHEKCQVQC